MTREARRDLRLIAILVSVVMVLGLPLAVIAVALSGPGCSSTAAGCSTGKRPSARQRMAVRR